MSYQLIIRSYRPKESIIFKRVVKFALFAAFSLWFLYHMRQPADYSGSRLELQLSNNHMSGFLGQKGSGGFSKATLITHPGLTLEDVTNPGEEGEILRYIKEIEVVEFYNKTSFLNEGNYKNTLSRGDNGQTTDNEDGSSNITKSNISFSDENGIPQHVRDRFIEVESNNSVTSSLGKSQSQSQSVIATRVGDGRNRSVDKIVIWLLLLTDSGFLYR